MLGCCDDDMMCKTLDWLVLAKCMDLYEWVDGSYLVCCRWTCYVGCDANEKGLGRGSRLLKRGGTIMCGLLEHGQKPQDDMLSNGLTCAECAATVISSYQTVPDFMDVQTCCVGARNVESRPKQPQLKVS